jgi:RNA polymerase sigma-70 factor (ECF subfamily)
MTGSITDGEDVVQDALFRAYRSLDTFDDSRPLVPWLFRIPNNLCIDFLRRRGVREEAEAAAAEPDFVEPAEPAGPTLGSAIEHLVLNLPPKERACVLLEDRASLETRSGPPRVTAPEHKQILRLYVERFNNRDWDGLRELISADARLLVADRYSGSFADGGYLGVYSRMTVTWRLTLGDVDGEPSIILLNLRNGAWEIEGIIRLDIGANGRIERISDYQHCPWVLTAGSVVVREFVG